MQQKEIVKFLKQFKNEVKRHENIIIFHHVRPDGDCLGSQQGMKLWLKKMFPKKNIYAIGSNEGLFNFLNFQFDNIPSYEILSQSLGIVVDANYSNRIKYGELITNNKIKTLIRIDHHPENDDINYKLRFVDSKYCSSAEQIANLIMIDNKNKKPSIEIAKFLYLGIYTDSNRFFYDYTSSRTHKIAAWLFESGLDFFDIHKKMVVRTLNEINFNKFVFENYKTHKNVIYCYISQSDIKKLKIEDSTSNRVDFLANIEGFDIWIFFIEGSDGKIRARFRSSNKDVASIARDYNGGGHKKAAGAILDSKDKIKEIIEKATRL